MTVDSRWAAAANYMRSFVNNPNVISREKTLATECRARCGEQSGIDIQPDCYEGLISPHLPLLDRWVRSKVPQNISPDDIVQQTLVLAWRHLPRLRARESVRTWLCAIALNVIRGHLRSPHSRLVDFDSIPNGVLDIRDSNLSPLECLERKEAFDALYRTIAKLPDRYRIVVELIDFSGFSTEDIMNKLSLSRTALKSRHFRARRMLLKLLGREAWPSLRSHLIPKDWK